MSSALSKLSKNRAKLLCKCQKMSFQRILQIGYNMSKSVYKMEMICYNAGEKICPDFCSRTGERT